MRRASTPGVAPACLHLNRTGLNMVLGPLELQVMRAMWEQSDHKLTNKEIQLALSRSGTDLALPTISATMHRLASKGYVREVREVRIFVYEATLAEYELEVLVVELVLSRLRTSWPELMHASDLRDMVFDDS